MGIERIEQKEPDNKILFSGLVVLYMLACALYPLATVISRNMGPDRCGTPRKRLENIAECYQLPAVKFFSPEYMSSLRTNLIHRDSMYVQSQKEQEYQEGQE